MSRAPTAAEAVAPIAAGHRVFVHSAAATPHALLRALVARAPELRDVELIHLHTLGDARWAAPALAASFRVANLFVGARGRRKRHDGRERKCRGRGRHGFSASTGPCRYESPVRMFVHLRPPRQKSKRKHQ